MAAGPVVEACELNHTEREAIAVNVDADPVSPVAAPSEIGK
jgi:hypothetical protein